jgi:spore coat protein A
MASQHGSRLLHVTTSRRSLLKLGAAAALAMSVPVRGSAPWSTVSARPVPPSTLAKFTEQVPIPPVIDRTAGGTLNLSMAPGWHQFHSQLPPAPTWGYGGASYLGPTIETYRGRSLTVTATNNLGAHPLAAAIDTTLHGALEADKTTPRVSLHLHGGNTSPASDGHPDLTFLPGTSYTYDYNNDQEAATIWYHDHALGITRLNVYAGLAGFYFLRDDLDTGRPGGPLNLPTGEFEIPLALQDRMFDTDGSLLYPPGDGMVWSPEFFGDIATVNGKVWPNLNVARGLYRLRLLNGSNSRVYTLALSSTVPMYQIGGDGGLLDAPVAFTKLTLAPGERADVLIDFTKVKAGTKIRLLNSAVTPFPNGPWHGHKGGAPLPEIMQFTVTNQVGFTGNVPAKLRATPIPRLPQPDPVRVRNLTLVEVIDPATDMPMMALLNNRPWHTSDIETPRVDTVEQWNIINTTMDTHPLHVHLVQFQLLGRQRFDAARYLRATYPLLPNADGADTGPWPAPSADAYTIGSLKAPPANERGWKDTIQANPGEITRLLVPFGANAAPGVPFGNSFTGEYVWHCHILEHEDNEMMLPYMVVP